MKKTIYLLSTLALLACGSEEQQSETASTTVSKIEARPVEIVYSEVKTLKETVHASGRFKTDFEKLLSFKIGGILKDLYFEKGDLVRAGDLLAKLDQREIKAQVEQAKEGLAKAERDLRRVKNLYQDSVATLEQLENTQTAYNIAREQLEIANFNFEHSEIRALEDGYILERFSERGQLVGPGSPVLQVGGASGTNQAWILKVGVSDREWAQVSKGDTALIKSDLFGGAIYRGAVSRKGQALNPATSTFDLEIRLFTAPENIAVGVFAEVDIQSQSKLKLAQIPYSALVDAGNNEAYVFVSKDGKTATLIPVSIYAIRQNTVLISNGLRDGQAVIVSGSAYLKEGDPIEIKTTKPKDI